MVDGNPRMNWRIFEVLLSHGEGLRLPQSQVDAGMAS